MVVFVLLFSFGDGINSVTWAYCSSPSRHKLTAPACRFPCCGRRRRWCARPRARDSLGNGIRHDQPGILPRPVDCCVRSTGSLEVSVIVDVPLIAIEVDDLAASHLLSLATGRHDRPPTGDRLPVERASLNDCLGEAARHVVYERQFLGRNRRDVSTPFRTPSPIDCYSLFIG